MANVIYRDVVCSTGYEYHYAVLSRLLLNGWESLAWSNGSTRVGGGAAPASAADLNAANAWWQIKHTASGRRFSVKRRGASHLWDYRYIDGIVPSLTTGDATTPDYTADGTYTRLFRNDVQFYPTTGTTATKLHLVVDNAACKFIALLRRSPYVGGSACSILLMEAYTDEVWAANPDPCWVLGGFADDNTVVNSYLWSTTYAGGMWHKRGISGQTWKEYGMGIENPWGVGGGAATPDGQDRLYEARFGGDWLPGPMGKSTLIRLLNPFRAPTVGIDAGAELNWAAFGQIAVPNDGVALVS